MMHSSDKSSSDIDSESPREASTRLSTLQEAVNSILQEAVSVLNADSVMLYPYNQKENRLETSTISIDESLETSAQEKAQIPLGARNVQSSNKTLFWPKTSADPQLTGAFATAEGIKSAVAIPLKAGEDLIGVLFINYRTPQGFSADEREAIAVFANQAAKSLRQARIQQMIFASMNIEMVAVDRLRVQMSLPHELEISEYFQNATSVLQAIDFIYSVFALINTGDIGTTKKLIELCKHDQDRTTSSNSQLHRLLEQANVQPLRLTYVHYGSEASFDLLGIGKALETLRDVFKDIVWRGKHEKQIAESERQIKQAESEQARLEVGKLEENMKWQPRHEEQMAEMELQHKQVDIERERLEVEKAAMEVITQKVDLLEKLAGLELPDEDKRLIVSSLIPRILTVSGVSNMPLLTEMPQSRSGQEDLPFQPE